MKKVIRWMRSLALPALGIALVFISIVACAVSLDAIIDPVSAKMADDEDPFGVPPGRAYSVSMLCISVAIGAAGLYLVLKPRRKI